MPELSAILILIIAAVTIVGSIIGWLSKGKHADEEKAAINAGWQDQFKAKQTEHDRLTGQNKALMEQVSQYQASNKDAKNRAKELSIAVQEAFARRDQLQREIKDIRSNLETTLSERDQLQSDISANATASLEASAKDAQIEKLKKELDNWQKRLPPLFDNLRKRNEEYERLQVNLNDANVRIAQLEAPTKLADEYLDEDDEFSRTQIETVQDSGALTNGLRASNDTLAAQNAESLYDVETDTPLHEAKVESRDRLQDIKGIGPAIAKTLTEMGIVSFRQIADMSEYDIDRVAQRLKGFRSRIYREDWIGQARDLRDKTNSE